MTRTNKITLLKSIVAIKNILQQYAIKLRTNNLIQMKMYIINLV